MPFHRITREVLAAALLSIASSLAMAAGLNIPALHDTAPDGYPAIRVRFPNGVIGIPDVTYAQHYGFRPLKLDLYLPPARFAHRGPRPLVVYVHGGAWIVGTRRGFTGPVGSWPAVLAALAARGDVVASVDYRLDGAVHFPAPEQDVKSTIRFLRVNARRYHIDPRRVAIWGASAGGQLSALTSVSCGVKAFEPPAPRAHAFMKARPAHAGVSDCVQGGVGWFGVYDFATVPIPPGQSGPQPYLGCPTFKCPKSTLEFASPTTYVSPSDPPMLLIHGLADHLVAVSQTREFAAKLRAAHVPVEVLYIPGVGHGFVGKTPAQTKAATLHALRVTFAFFHRLFARKGH